MSDSPKKISNFDRTFDLPFMRFFISFHFYTGSSLVRYIFGDFRKIELIRSIFRKTGSHIKGSEFRGCWAASWAENISRPNRPFKFPPAKSRFSASSISTIFGDFCVRFLLGNFFRSFFDTRVRNVISFVARAFFIALFYFISKLRVLKNVPLKIV